MNTKDKIYNVIDDVINKEDREVLIKFAKDNMKNSKDDELRPWFESNNFEFLSIKDLDIRAVINSYRFKLTQLVNNTYQKIVYPVWTDLVIWNKNKEMEEHIDNGYDDPNNFFYHRHFSTVTYLNDDYEGGETFINDNGNEILIQPKAGRVLIMLSDSRCPHGVKKVNNGIRVTLPIWFTMNQKVCQF